MNEQRRRGRRWGRCPLRAALLLAAGMALAGVSAVQAPDLAPDELLRNIAAKRFTGKPVTIRVTRDNLESAIDEIRKASGLSIVIDPSLYEIVRRTSSDQTIILANGMPWDALLEALSREFQLGIVIESGSVAIRIAGVGPRLVGLAEGSSSARKWIVVLILLAAAGTAGILIARKKARRSRGRTRFALESGPAEEIKTRILFLFEVEKIHHDEDLSLQNLSTRLSLPAHHISRVFNEILGSSFSRLVNTYRVNEVKKRLADAGEAGRTILDIAFEAGFGTKTGFNKVFKQHTGMTPSEFREKSRN